MRSQPAFVSVVLPVRNGERFIGEQMQALASQAYTGRWELVVVDNGCTDATVEIVERWRGLLPALTVVDARSRRGINFARAAGARAAQGDFLVFCDADDMVAPGWLAAMAQAASSADLVGGPLELESLNTQLLHAWRGGGALMTSELNSGYGFLPYVSGGNCGVWADVVREVGWDESFAFGASDIEFAWRAQLACYRVSFAPEAVVRLRYRDRLLPLARQHFFYGAGEPLLYSRFRDSGMTSDPRAALRTWIWIATRLPRAITDQEFRGNWLRVVSQSCGRLWGSLRWRVLFL